MDHALLIFPQSASKTKKKFELNGLLGTVYNRTTEKTLERDLTNLVTGNEQKQHAMVTQS